MLKIRWHRHLKICRSSSACDFDKELKKLKFFIAPLFFEAFWNQEIGWEEHASKLPGFQLFQIVNEIHSLLFVHSNFSLIKRIKMKFLKSSSKSLRKFPN